MTRYAHCGVLIVLLLVSSTSLLAQNDGQSQQERLTERRREKATHLAPAQVSTGEARVLGLEKARFPNNIFVKGFHGIRPVIGGMPSGSGLVGGVGYVRGLENGLFTLTTSAAYSTRGFTQLDARLDLPTAQSGRPIRGFVTAAYQDYPGLRFFGLGNNSNNGDRVFFGQENLIVGGGLTAELTRFVDIGVDVSRMTVEVGSGNRDPSIDSVFDLSQAPLFRRQTDFNIYGAYVKVNLLEQYNFPPAGVDIVVGGWRYDDTDLDRGSFTRVVGEVRAQIPIGYHNRRIALRARTSHSSADRGQVVPIYMMETIGGATTLRGYREYRFRDTRNLLLMAEYRWEVWTYMDFALFYDAGKVFSDEKDLDFRNMHTGYGFGMRVRAPGGTFFNIDLARSTEGFRLHIGGGPRF